MEPLFTLEQRRNLVHSKFLSCTPVSTTTTTSLFFFFYPVNLKTCPQKRPNCPVSLKCCTKSSASSARPQGALMFSRCLDLPSVTAPHAFESCVRIFFCLSYDNLFSSSSPQVLRFCHRLQKPLYKIKEQWIRWRKNKRSEGEWSACKALSLIFKLIYNYVQHYKYTL